MADHQVRAAVSRPWRTVVPDEVASRAVATAVEIAHRLAEAKPTTDVDSGAGCALLFGQLDQHQPDQGWAVAARDSLALALRAAERLGANYSGLFGGLSGVAFAANALSQHGTRYGRLLATLDAAIVVAATTGAERIAADPRGLPFHAFDVISGVAGLGAYLLRRPEDAALREVLTALVAFCDDDNGIPRWYTPPDPVAPETPITQLFAEGVFNCGLAHGIPGPMALLALAEQAGISVPGQPKAIGRVARWLTANRADDEWGPNWPSGFPMAGGKAGPPTHNAWCYGSSGVARSLWLAGTALADDRLRAIAVDAMTAVCHRPAEARRLDHSPSLCHGVAGVLQIVLRFAQDTGDGVFTAAATKFTEMLLALYEPEYRFGYRAPTATGEWIDAPGLVEGTSGAALALLAAGTDVAPDWDRMFLLA